MEKVTLVAPDHRKDYPRLKQIWHDIFGDEKEFIDLFFTELSSCFTPFAAKSNGSIVGAAYLLRISELVSGGDVVPCPYIYAVGVMPEYRGRGIGRELVSASREAAHGLSALVPAEDSLFDYYERSAGYRRAFFAEKATAGPAASANDVIPISAEKYSALREGILAERVHLRFCGEAISFFGKACGLFGGGLFRIGTETDFAIAGCEYNSGLLSIKELLCRDGNERGYASSLAAHFGAESSRYVCPDNKKHPENVSAFGMLYGSDLQDCYFGPAFD